MRMHTNTLDVTCLAGLLALTLVAGVGGMKVVSARAAAANRQEKALQASQKELAEAQTVLSSLQRAIQANQPALERLYQRLPETQSMGDFLFELDAMISRNRVALSQVAPQTPVAEVLSIRTPLQFSCRGSFLDLHTVLYSLENQTRVVRVNQVTLRRGSSEQECMMDVVCDVYGR